MMFLSSGNVMLKAPMMNVITEAQRIILNVLIDVIFLLSSMFFLHIAFELTGVSFAGVRV